MQYKLCILAAGKGTRVSHSHDINKALLPVGNVSVLSRIINKFPLDVEVVIASGYKGEQLKNFVALAHHDRVVTFVEVDRWEGKGCGPGYSLLQCREHLQCPFIFTGADTIVTDDVPEPRQNWAGVAPVDDSEPFLVFEVEDQRVVAFHDKVKNAPSNLAFIGLAGVYDWQAFWTALEHNQDELVKDELQVATGLRGLLDGGLTTTSFTWFDTGSDENYATTRRSFKEVVAPKEKEQLYMQGETVIKFFADEDIVSHRVERAEYLGQAVPSITERRGQFYTYTKVPGQLLSNVDDDTVFSNFLTFCHDSVWQPVELNVAQQQEFKEKCLAFYQAKTLQRVEQFYQTTDIVDRAETINGQLTPKLMDLIARIDWHALADGTAVVFHGDTQPENVIVKPDGGFALIDWRQDFAGLLTHGDIYYDFAKLDHALLINGELIRQNRFSVEENNGAVEYTFATRPHLLRYSEVLHRFILAHNYDLGKVKLLNALVYLNIAPLHHAPYNALLYYLGKDLLAQHYTHDTITT